MHATVARLGSVVLLALGGAEAVFCQVPRPPRKEVVLEARRLPIPFPGYNQAYTNQLAFSKDGTLIATGAGSNLGIWDVESGKLVARMQLDDKQYAVNVAFTEDGKTLVSNGTDDPMIRFWDVKTGKQTRERPHANAPKEPLPPPDGKSERRYRNPFVAFAPGARTMAVYDPSFSKIEMVDTVSGQSNPKLEKAGARWGGSWTFSRDGKRIATGSSWQHTIEIWNAETGELLRTMQGAHHGKDRNGYSSLRFSHDGKYVFGYASGSGQNDHHITIWGVEDGLEYCRLPIWGSPGEMSPDGRMFVTGSGGRFFLYDLLADKMIDNVKLPTPNFYHIECTPDGTSLALLGLTGTTNNDYSIYLTPFPTLGDDAVPVGRLTAADQADLWSGLSSANLFRRRYVTKVFKAHAEQAVALVEGKVKPVSAAARQRVDDLIKTLDDTDFERRDAATRDLQAEAFHFEPLLRATVKTAPAGEIRNRATFILNASRDQRLPAHLLGDLRGIELLESLATPAARKLLEALAAGAQGARATNEAALALKRIGSP